MMELELSGRVGRDMCEGDTIEVLWCFRREAPPAADERCTIDARSIAEHYARSDLA
jgi:hypothetical protein